MKWLWLRSLRVFRTGFTVKPQMLFSILTFVAIQRLAHHSQSINNGTHAAAFSKRILDVWRIAAEVGALKQLVLLHVAQTRDQGAAADWEKPGV